MSHSIMCQTPVRSPQFLVRPWYVRKISHQHVQSEDGCVWAYVSPAQLQSHTKVRDSSSGLCWSRPQRLLRGLHGPVLTASSRPSSWAASSLARWYGDRRPSETARRQKQTTSTLPDPLSRSGTTKEVTQEAPSHHLCAACGAVWKIHFLWDCMQHDSLLHCEAGLW